MAKLNSVSWNTIDVVHDAHGSAVPLGIRTTPTVAVLGFFSCRGQGGYTCIKGEGGDLMYGGMIEISEKATA